MKINLKIIIPAVIVVIVIIAVAIIMTTPRGSGGTTSTQENTQTATISERTQTEQQTETRVPGLRVAGVGVGYLDYTQPYNGEMVGRGLRGLIELNVTLEGYGTLKKVLLELKNYGNITVTATPQLVSSATGVTYTYRIELRLNDTSSDILNSLKQSRPKVYVFYEVEGKEYTTPMAVIPLDLSRRETTPIGR